MNWIFYLLLLILLISALTSSILQGVGPTAKHVVLGYGKEDEDIGTLIDRIQYSNQYPGRINMVPRFAFLACLISGLACVTYNSMRQPRLVILCILITWMVLTGFNSFFMHHCDKFTSYYTKRNIQHLRKKLNLKDNTSTLHSNEKTFDELPGAESFIFT
jgi:hypothetical protein